MDRASLLREYVRLLVEGWSDYENMVTSDKTKFQLSYGVELVDVSNEAALAQDSREWFFYDADRKKSGTVALFTYPEYGKTIGEIFLDSSLRGKGIGAEAVKKLASHYGSICSDPQANTSSAAVKMWQRLGAEKIPTTKNTKGYMYRLRG